METPHTKTDDDTPPGYSGPETEAEARARGLCGAETRAGTPCRKFPADGADRCRFHGGSSTGPRDPSALKGNDHAADNAGGGAPEGNTNALESGAFVPLERIPERLSREQLHGVARWEWYAVLTARARRPGLQERRRRRLAERWALLEVRKLSATVDAWLWDDDSPGRGLTYSRERSAETDDGETVAWVEQRENPSLRVEHRAGRARREIGELLGLSDVGAAPVEAAEQRAAPPLSAPTRDDHTDD